MTKHDDNITPCATKNKHDDNDNNKNNDKNKEEEYEEDWSMYINHNANTTTSSSYAAHNDICVIPLSSDTTTNGRSKNRNDNVMTLSCIKSLSPLDMMDLWSGKCDATGHKIWTGALFFIEVFVRDFPVSYAPSTTTTTTKSSSTSKRDQIQKALTNLRKTCFYSQNVLELGSGTGISGISLLKSPASSFVRPFRVILTDSKEDEGVLHLCLDNCVSNLMIQQDGHMEDDDGMVKANVDKWKLSTCYPVNGSTTAITPSGLLHDCKDGNASTLKKNGSISNIDISTACTTSPIIPHFAVCPLTWGNDDDDDDDETFSIMKQKNSNQKNDNDNILQLMPSSYDTVFATDVLYDLSSLSPLFTTASKMLRGGGYFVLSHVPRASVQDYHDDDDDDDGKTIIGTANVLEHLICNEAIKHGFLCGSSNHSEDQIDLERLGKEEEEEGMDAKRRKQVIFIRPNDIKLLWEGNTTTIASNELTYDEMDETGVSIMIFQKDDCNNTTTGC